MKTDSLADAQKCELRCIDIWLYLLANSLIKPFETTFSSDNDTYSKIPSYYQYFFQIIKTSMKHLTNCKILIMSAILILIIYIIICYESLEKT